jgi:hypothetical protein
MSGDVLSCARVESDDDRLTLVCAVVPTVPHVAERDVKPDGTSRNRIADEATAVSGQTDRSSPAGYKKIFLRHRLGADPRAPPRLPVRQRTVPIPAVDAPALDTGSSAGGGTRGPVPSSATSGKPASVASGLPPPGTPDRNTATGHTADRRTARIPSIGSDAAVAHNKSLALQKIVDHHEVDPRERQLPKGQVPEGTSVPLRDALYPQPYPTASLPLSLIAAAFGRHYPAGRPPPTTAGHLLPWPAKWPNSRPPLTRVDAGHGGAVDPGGSAASAVDAGGGRRADRLLPGPQQAGHTIAS